MERINKNNQIMKEYYIETFPTDDFGERMNSNTTFLDLANTINNDEDVYEIIGVGDSLIRERLFMKLSENLDTDYETVYNTWLKTKGYQKLSIHDNFDFSTRETLENESDFTFYGNDELEV